MSDEMKNPDRDERHRKRREMGESEDEPDGRSIAEKLYGGLPTDSDKIADQADAE